MTERLRCDFCSAFDPPWEYPARDLVSTPAVVDGVAMHLNSTGNWTACEDCATLIDAGNRDGLAERSAETHPERVHIPHGLLLRMMRRLHDDFWANRDGPVQRITDQDDTT